MFHHVHLFFQKLNYLPIDVMSSLNQTSFFHLHLACPKKRPPFLQVLKELGIDDPLLKVAQELEKAPSSSGDSSIKKMLIQPPEVKL